MIEVSVFRDREGRITGFRVSGHSGWAARGSDIVCAGVAALTQTAVLGLVHHARARVETAADDGFLECRWTPEGEGEPENGGSRQTTAVQAIFETMVLGLREISWQYPRHVTVMETRT